jgi:hypothetical protein
VNYAALFETIKGYLENDFPATSFTDSAGTGTATLTSTEQINTFIVQAEKRIFNMVQFPALRKNVTGSFTSGNQYLTCPDDFLAPYSLAMITTAGAYSFLLNKDVSYIRESYPDPAATGTPQHYALFGPNYSDPTILTFIVGPTPDAGYSVEMHYFFYPESITTASTTWLGDNFDPVLLYGALVEGYTFMKGEPDLVAQYEKKFQESIALAKKLGEGMEKRDQYRSGDPRVPV